MAKRITKMNWLEKEKEQEEIQKIVEQEKENNDPNFRQYGFLKWRIRE